jgi:hypothetical protein
MSRERPAREPASAANAVFATVHDRVLEAMEAADRGPRQNALFALWLFLRQCDGAMSETRLSDRASAARLDALERRLSSLSLPAPLRRTLPACLREIRGSDPRHVPIAVQQLAAPVRETLGAQLGDAVAQAARRARLSIRASAEPRGSA